MAGVQRAPGLLGKCLIRVFPALSDSAFALHKLAPTRNCVRLGSSETGPATPEYNQSVLEDIFLNVRMWFEAFFLCNSFFVCACLVVL